MGQVVPNLRVDSAMPTFVRNQILLRKDDREDCAPEAALTTSPKSTKRGAPRLLNYIKHNKYGELNTDCFSKLFLVALGNRTNIKYLNTLTARSEQLSGDFSQAGLKRLAVRIVHGKLRR